MKIVGRVLIGGLCSVATAALAQEPRKDEPAKAEARKEPEAKPVAPPLSFVSRHSGRFGAETVAYAATAGETFLLDDKGEPKASIFTFAYVKDAVKDPATRPVTFVWNGGPGSSSIWLHMGSLGPRRVVVPSDAKDDGPPPYRFEDNAASPLDVTDLVFVDPVGTGWSRALGKHESKEFWGLNEDADTITELIRTWVTENKRWASPKYLLGESFGTMRAAAVAGRMEGEAAMSLNGVILISQCLDYQGSTPEHDNLIAYVTYLPTMAATAWYHGKVKDRPADLRAFLVEARAFAVDEYAPALFKGNRLDPASRARIRQRLSRFTGLSEDYLEQADLRPLAGRFLKELLRAEGKTVGRLDGRYLGEDVDRLAEQPDGDPASYAISSAYVAGLNTYLADSLAVKMDRPYAASGGGARPPLEVAPRARGEPLGALLPEHGPRSEPRAAAQPGAAGAGGRGLLRLRHPVLRCRVHLRLARLPARAPHLHVLRGRAHDVPAPAVPRRARGERAHLHPRREVGRQWKGRHSMAASRASRRGSPGWSLRRPDGPSAQPAAVLARGVDGVERAVELDDEGVDPGEAGSERTGKPAVSHRS